MNTDVTLADASDEVLSIDSGGFHDVELEDLADEEPPEQPSPSPAEAAAFALPAADHAAPSGVLVTEDHLHARPFEGVAVTLGGSRRVRHGASAPKHVRRKSAQNVSIKLTKKDRRKGVAARKGVGAAAVGVNAKSAGVGVDASMDVSVDVGGAQVGAKGDDLPPIPLSDWAPKTNKMWLVR